MIRWIALVALFVGCSDKKTKGLEPAQDWRRRYDRPGPEPGGAERQPSGQPPQRQPARERRHGESPHGHEWQRAAAGPSGDR